MTGNGTMADVGSGQGERRLKQQRKRYIMVIVGLMAAGGIIGGVVGTTMGWHFVSSGFADTDFPRHIQWLVIAGVVGFALSVTIGTVIYFRTIDELEYEANKNAGLVGINVYAMLYMSWWALAAVNVTPAPHGETIFLITMAAAVAAFCWRRFR